MINKENDRIYANNKIFFEEDCFGNSNIDVNLIQFNLSLSYEDRVKNHQRALDSINEILKARKQVYGESQPPFQAQSRFRSHRWLHLMT